MRLYQSDKTWYIDYQHDGKRIRKSLKTTHLTTARKLAKALEQDQVLGRLPTVQGQLSLSRFRDEVYLEWAKIHQKPSTYQESRNTMRKFAGFTPPRRGQPLGEAVLQDITRQDIEDYKSARLDQVVRNTVNGDLRVIRAFFNRAVEWEYLSQTPFRAVRLFKIDRSARVRFLSEAEIQRLLETARRMEVGDPLRYADLYPLIATAIYAGLRKAELGWLSWEDIDLDRGTLTVLGERQVGDQVITTKNYQTRTLPLHPQLKTILQPYRRETGYCFKPDLAKPSRRYRYDFREAMSALSDRAGLKGVGAHVLRHTFASHLVMAGVDLPTVKELMGHADISTTMIYAHLAQEHKQEAIQKLYAATALGTDPTAHDA